MKVIKELARQAKADGICTPWYNQLMKLHDSDVAAMADMYLKGIDFCLSNNYPDNEFLRTHFKGKMEQYGIFLDDEVLIENKPKCVCLGATRGRIETNGFGVCEIFLKNDSELNVIAKDNAFVMIDIFDNSVVNVYASDRAKVCVNHYGGTIMKYITNDAIIKIREKNKKTY